MLKTTLETSLRDREYRQVFAEERFVTECLEVVCAWMEKCAVTQERLGELLGIPNDEVRYILSGNGISLRTLARVVHVLEGAPVLTITTPVEENK